MPRAMRSVDRHEYEKSKSRHRKPVETQAEPELNDAQDLGATLRRPPSLPPPLPRASSRSARDGTELSEGALVSGQYRVERVVGRMGSCVLVKVRHARLGQRFLLKYLGPEA